MTLTPTTGAGAVTPTDWRILTRRLGVIGRSGSKPGGGDASQFCYNLEYEKKTTIWIDPPFWRGRLCSPCQSGNSGVLSVWLTLVGGF